MVVNEAGIGDGVTSALAVLLGGGVGGLVATGNEFGSNVGVRSPGASFFAWSEVFLQPAINRASNSTT